MHKDFSTCAMSKDKDKKRMYTKNNNINNNIKNNNNINKDICGRTFNVSYVRTMPYYHLRDDVINPMMSACCGACADIETNRTFEHVAQINQTSIQFTDFLFPFLASKSLQTVHGLHFVPLIDAPGLYFVTLKTLTPIGRPK